MRTTFREWELYYLYTGYRGRERSEMILLKCHLYLKSNFKPLSNHRSADIVFFLYLCVFIFDSTHQCRTRRTCNWGGRNKKVEGVAKRWWRQDTWHFGVSRLMERSLEGRFLGGGEREREAENNEGEKAAWRVPVEALGFVSSPWQPLPMSYQIITLSSPMPLHPTVTPTALRPYDAHSMTPPETAKGLNVAGYKTMVTSGDFSNNLRDHPRILVLRTIVSTYTHRCVPMRRVSMKHLIYYSGEWKIQRRRESVDQWRSQS